MIQRANFNLKLTREELKSLFAIKPFTGHSWDNPINDEIALIKNKIRVQLEAVQKKCSYCGLLLKGTSKGEIEHIAPKATGFRHPEFTFTLKNLTLSCHWCNTSEKKGTKETIAIKHKIYSKCEFKIVHPYFDDPQDHYDWTDNTIEILIQVKDESEKAINTIEMFKLDTPEMNEHRAKEIRFEQIKSQYRISKNNEDLIEKVNENKREI